MKRSIKFLTSLGLSMALLTSSATITFAKTDVKKDTKVPSTITVQKPKFDKVIEVFVDEKSNATADSTERTVPFKEIFDVDEEYKEDAIALSRTFIDAINPDTLYFDFGKAINLVKEDKTLTITRTLNQTISKKTTQVSVVIDELVKLLTNLGVKLTDETIKEYENTLTTALTNLKESDHKNFVVWNKTSSNSTTYTYSIFFAVKNARTKTLIAGLPVGLTITVDTSKEKLLGMTIKDKQSIDVNVKAIQVVKLVKKH